MIRVTELDRALQSTLAVLAKVDSGHLDAPTPCASWDVSALINHFIATTRWWASVVTGEGADTEADYAAGDYVAAYEESIPVTIAAFPSSTLMSTEPPLPSASGGSRRSLGSER